MHSQPFLSREPILGEKTRLIGYRVHVGRPAGARNPVDDAACLAGALDPNELDTLTHGQPAFVGVGRASLLAGLPPLMSAQRVVVELPSDLDDSRAVRAACRQRRDEGYMLAIDDFSIDAPAAGLAALVDYLKIPVTARDRDGARARTVACFRPGGTELIATGVQTLEEWEAAASDGFRCFQGFFLGRPILRPGQPVSVRQVASLRLLRALNEPNLSNGQLEDIVKHDADLCYWLLRSVNSAAYALPRTVSSIGDALLMLGREAVRRWASVWAVAGLNTHAHNELVIMSTTRARVCELLAASGPEPDLAGEAFLAGMCSLLDDILGRPMTAIVAELPLSAAVKAALDHQENPLSRVLETVIAYERGAFASAEKLAVRARVNAGLIPAAFLEALRWSREFQQSGTNPSRPS